MPNTAKSPPAATGGAPNALSCRLAEGNSEGSPIASTSQCLPSRATIARKWPALKINRYTWRWHDDVTGAKGEDFASLSEFMSGGGR